MVVVVVAGTVVVVVVVAGAAVVVVVVVVVGTAVVVVVVVVAGAAVVVVVAGTVVVAGVVVVTGSSVDCSSGETVVSWLLEVSVVSGAASAVKLIRVAVIIAPIGRKRFTKIYSVKKSATVDLFRAFVV